MINATQMTVNPFGENLYILWDEATHDAVVVDPGMMRAPEREMVTKFIEGQELNVTHILLTHLHIDHITSARWLADKTGADVCGSMQDAQLGLELPDQVARFHINIEAEPLTLDRDLTDGDTIPWVTRPSRCCMCPAIHRVVWLSICPRAGCSSAATPSSTAAWAVPTCGAATWLNSSTASARRYSRSPTRRLSPRATVPPPPLPTRSVATPFYS